MVTNWAKGQVVVGHVHSSGKSDDAHRSASLQKEAIQRYVDEAGCQVSDWYVDDVRHLVSFQIPELERLAAQAAMQVIASYVDVGYDGDNVEQPALQRLLAAAQSGETGSDVVVVCCLSRLFRSAEDLHVLISLLRNLGVEVVSVFEPYTPPVQEAVYSRVSWEAQQDAPEEAL